ncbi:MAG TPA: hypothetical protein VFA71_05920 [Terriglobales bacterium]|nr:hypothetical protein [Terriglobales bacterium]
MRYCRNFSIVVVVPVLLFLAGCAEKRDYQQTLRSNFAAPSSNPQVLAAYQPWFGESSHINVGYSSQDPVVLQQQIEKARNLGISGFVVNWYGPAKPFEDHAYSLLQQAASSNNFTSALMYDESEDSGHSTDEAIEDLNYAYEHYIGPNAPAKNAYLTFEGRPVIFIFPKGGKTDWQKVRAAVNNWISPPLLIYEDINPSVAGYFDGFYAWVHPGSEGWSHDGSNWGRQYLESFYSHMVSDYPGKIAVGAAWPGFDDSHAGWSLNRHMNPRCGKTFEESLRLYRRFYDEARPLPFLLIVTWNDYEEGTAIEPGLPSC